MVRALITNDDGIDSPGLWALAAAARDAGLDVIVAAPHLDSSGVGTSVLSVQDGARTNLHARELPGLLGVEAWAVEGHPAYIVYIAGRGWLDPAPDVVLSGINIGANVGHAVLHSGTVAAALTAARHGWRGLAVSLETAWPPPEQLHWDTAAAVLTRCSPGCSPPRPAPCSRSTSPTVPSPCCMSCARRGWPNSGSYRSASPTGSGRTARVACTRPSASWRIRPSRTPTPRCSRPGTRP